MLKKLFALIVSLVALPVIAQGQTYVYPALSTNNAFTGTNSFSNSTYFPGLASLPCLATGAAGILEAGSCMPAGTVQINGGGSGATTSQGAATNIINGNAIDPSVVNNAVNAAAYSSLSAAIAACPVVFMACEIDLPANTTIPAGTQPVNPTGQTIRLVGQSQITSIVQCGSGDCMYNIQAEHVNLQAISSSTGIIDRLSGIDQLVQDVQISQSGVGSIATVGVESLAAVSLSLTNVYCEGSPGGSPLPYAATTCTSAVSSGGNQTGNLVILGGDFRGATTGLALSNVLSGSITGGSIEASGTQGVLASSSPYFSFYFTEFESNGTNDIYWPTGGYLKVQGSVFSGGTTNNLNCPNTTCTAQLEIDGAIGSSSEGWIIGNSISMGSKFQNSFISGTSFFTNNAGGLLSLSEISTHDSTVVSDTIGYNGDSAARQCLLPGSSGFPFCMTADNTGNLTLEANGVIFLQNSGNANVKFFGIVNAVSGFDVNGSPLNTGNLFDWTNSGISNNFVPIWNAGTGKWTPGALSTGMTGMTNGQVPLANTATTVSGSKALAGTGAGLVTGPTTTTTNHCTKFNDTVGTVADSGAACYTPTAPSTPTRGSCGTGSPTLSGDSSGFSITGITSGTTLCTVTFSPSLSKGICSATSNVGYTGVTAASVSSITFGLFSTQTILYANCE